MARDVWQGCPLCGPDEECPGEHELVEAGPLRADLDAAKARIAELEAQVNTGRMIAVAADRMREHEQKLDARIAELEALRSAVGVLIEANDSPRGIHRPRTDIAWRDVKRAYAATTPSSTGERRE